MIGQVVGQYRIIEKLGEGGMGAVYKGIDLMVEREVAIKMLRPEIARQPELVERFRSEAITLAKLNYPGIATLYNFFRQGDDFFMVMEFVSGRTLDSIVRESGAMPWERAVPLFCRILEAIQPAHQAGILHRDIKPSNIMLTSWGGVKVMDFGIARVLGAARMTREGRMVGTIEYIAPERLKGDEADARADIYSLGVVLYEMLTGRLPFESTSEFEIMRGHVQDAPPPLGRFRPDVPGPIEVVVMQSLTKSVDQRIQSCGAYISALHNATQDLTTSVSLPIYNAPEPFNEGSAQPSSPHTQVMDYPTRSEPGPTVMPAAIAPVGTVEMNATRFEPRPGITQPYMQPAIPVPQNWPHTSPVVLPIDSPVAGRNPAPKTPGFLSQMTWKHYAGAGGALVVLIVLAALLGLGRTKTGIEDKPAAAPAANIAPSQKPPPMPVRGGTQPDASVPVPPRANENELQAKAKEAAKKRADALKALDEQD